jgi:DNA ligase-1
MKNFAALFSSLDQTNKTKAKVGILKDYFNKVSDKDKIWTLALFSGRKPKRPVNTTLLKNWAIETSEIPAWLFDESYHVAGDLAETISLLLPFPEYTSDKSLSEWIKFIIIIGELSEEEKKEKILQAWNELTQQEKFVFNKLLTGSFRVGVSQSLVVQALAELTGIDKSILAHRFMGNWNPEEITFDQLIHQENSMDDVSRPYPFFLAHPVDGGPEKLGDEEEWQAEWKWDGIRAQIIKRNGNFFVWSRGEELVTDKFPELESLNKALPDNTVLDGELLPFIDNQPLPFAILQTRIGRKNITAKVLKDSPIAFMAYDIMEWQGKDIRSERLDDRRKIVEELVETIGISSFKYSKEVIFNSWEDLAAERENSRSNFAEGFMLKKKSSTYQVGRKRGDWWKWKIDPLTIDAVLIYAQKGHGKRADLYTDYTFGVWKEDKLVPFAKAYSGLTDQEIRDVDSFVRRNTVEKFGPVRTVKPELVFEIGFEGIQESSRHKCGIAVRFPRILRWRKDKKLEEADHLYALKEMLHVLKNC